VPGRTGLVAAREDPDALAAALRTMADLDRDGRRRMGRAGRAHAEAHYAWPRLVERTEAIYAGAIGERARRRGSRRTYGGSPEH
jgi:glycosyltransferase involved in cell wall biosynthesis